MPLRKVIYNAENRPLSFTSADGQSRIDCDYDYQGRRYTKKVSIQGNVISHERYLYRGYLQIAALDMLNRQALIRRILWDPKEPSATRPLALLQEGKLYSYGHDFLKNVTEIFDETNKIATTYDYSPYGAVTETSTTNNITQPYQWSSEIADPELALSYYNYRYYNPRDGRWINRDPIQEQGGWNLYGFVRNHPIGLFDDLGMLKIDVIFNEIKVANVPKHIYTSLPTSKRKSYTTRDHDFICNCAYNPHLAIVCTASYTPKIYLDRRQSSERHIPLRSILGHEQRHVSSRNLRINKLLDVLKKVDMKICLYKECAGNAKKIQEQYKKKIDDDFKKNDHQGDSGATYLSPKNGVPYPPVFS